LVAVRVDKNAAQALVPGKQTQDMLLLAGIAAFQDSRVREGSMTRRSERERQDERPPPY
jgi:hypothetical protein